MSKKTDPTEARKHPPKKIVVRGVPVIFSKINNDFPSSTYFYSQHTGYQEMYPSVYSLDVLKDQDGKAYGFAKSYDFLSDYYMEKERLINYRQYSLYNYITSLCNRGYRVSIRGAGSGAKRDRDERVINDGGNDADIKGLAHLVGVKPATLIADMDRLEDCFLIHRIRRLDLRGIPAEIVVHTPTPPHILEWSRGFKLRALHKRVKDHATLTMRGGAMMPVKGDLPLLATRNPQLATRTYFRSQALPERFQFDYGIIKKAFGERRHEFTSWAFAFCKLNLEALAADKPAFDKRYRDDLAAQMDEWGIQTRDDRHKCFTAAGKFRTVYCPLESELIGI